MNCELIGWCTLKPEVQAAWAQAVLSVVAVGIAIYVPAKIEWRQRHRSFYAITGLLVAIAERVAELFSKVTSPPIQTGAAIEDPELKRLIDALATIPVHELPESGLVVPVIETLSDATVVLETYRKMTHNGQPGTPAWEADIDWMGIHKGSIDRNLDLTVRMGRYSFGSWLYRWRDRHNRRLQRQRR